MSDIEELAQLLGQPLEDLDWGGEPFCFLENDHQDHVHLAHSGGVLPPPHVSSHVL